VNVDVAQRISDRVSAVRGVARLSGRMGGAATYGAGRRVEGVRGSERCIEIHIVAAGSVMSLPAVADAVRQAVGPIADGAQVDVFVDDLDLDVVDLDALEPGALDPVGTGPPP